ncbi:hypothetical protein GALL_543600 [mine drainage metagenome]|uniref:Uncharacterized protein n=1 Tax=mine drainage metagenome TaxID=410659 RepID=A0A1J5PKN6_9ZZZZ
MITDLPDVFDQGMVDQWTDDLIIIVLIGPIDLRGDFQGDAASDGDLDGAIHALLRRDPAKHPQIAWIYRPRRQQVFRQAVVDGTNPVGPRHWTPLNIRNRNHGNRRESGEYRLVLGQIKPAVQGGHKRGRLAEEQRKRIVVEVEMQKVEFLIVALLPNAFQHHHMQRVGIADGSVEAERLRPSRVKFR